MEQFGECVSRARAEEVRQLLAAPPETPLESRAITLLSPSLSGCVPKGQDFRFSKTVLRGALAEGMYRLSKAAETAALAQETR
jgi:hypothetical protein